MRYAIFEKIYNALLTFSTILRLDIRIRLTLSRDKRISIGWVDALVT